MARYAQESERIMAILERFSDRVEPVSIDEAFLDATGSGRALGSGETIGRKLKQAIRDETGAHGLGRRRRLQARGQGRLRHAQAGRADGGAARHGGGVPRAAAA